MRFPGVSARDRDALADILTAIRLDQDFPFPDRETFLASDVLQDAVVHNLEIIGAASMRLNEQLPALLAQVEPVLSE